MSWSRSAPSKTSPMCSRYARSSRATASRSRASTRRITYASPPPIDARSRNPQDQCGRLALPLGMRRESALPQILGLAEMFPRPARQHEEEIAQPIDVPQRSLPDRFHPRKGQDAALGTTADRARLMQEPSDPSPAGENERLERPEVLLALVDEPLEGRHFGLAHPEHAFVLRVRRGGELAAEVEQLVLQSAQDFVEPSVFVAARELLGVEDPGQSDDRVQLIDGAVGLDARGILRHAPPPYEGGIAFVACPRVHAGDADRHDPSRPFEASTLRAS